MDNPPGSAPVVTSSPQAEDPSHPNQTTSSPEVEPVQSTQSSPPLSEAIEASSSVAPSVIVPEVVTNCTSNVSPTHHNNHPISVPNCTPAPPVEVKLFVGRLPRTHTEEMIKPLFEQFGMVVEVVIIRDKQTQNHKGSAFVRMSSICQADLAIRALNNTKVVDPSLGPLTVKYAIGELENLGLPATAVDPAVDQAKLFVGSLPKTVTEVQVRELFCNFGAIDEVFIMKDPAGNPKGCAFVKFGYKEQAIFAMNQLNQKMTVAGAPRPLEVRFAAPRRPPGERAQEAAMGALYGQAQQMAAAGFHRPGAVGVGNNAAPRQAGPWKEYFSGDGRPYYHNEHTGTTQWDRPPEFDDNSGTAGGFGIGGGQEATGPAGANIFIFHVPNEWTHSDLVHNFGHWGNVVSGRIAQDRQTGRNRGFAFVSYESPDAANSAVSNMNGFTACGKRLKVTIKKGEEGASQGVTQQQQQPGMMQQVLHPGMAPPFDTTAWLAG